MWNVCQRSHNVPTTYEPYAGIVGKFCACTNFFDDLAVLRRIAAYFSVLLTYTKHTHNIYSTYTSVFAKFFTHRHMLAKNVKVWQHHQFISVIEIIKNTSQLKTDITQCHDNVVNSFQGKEACIPYICYIFKILDFKRFKIAQMTFKVIVLPFLI